MHVGGCVGKCINYQDASDEYNKVAHVNTGSLAYDAGGFATTIALLISPDAALDGIADTITAGRTLLKARKVETVASTAPKVAAKTGDLTTLFRAVGKDEMKDIERTGVYRAAPGGTEGKYFFPTQAQAENFSSMMEKAGQGSTCITSGCIPTSVLRGIETIHPAGEGSAYFIPSNLLPYFSNIIVP